MHHKHGQTLPKIALVEVEATNDFEDEGAAPNFRKTENLS